MCCCSLVRFIYLLSSPDIQPYCSFVSTIRSVLLKLLPCRTCKNKNSVRQEQPVAPSDPKQLQKDLPFLRFLFEVHMISRDLFLKERSSGIYGGVPLPIMCVLPEFARYAFLVICFSCANTTSNKQLYVTCVPPSRIPITVGEAQHQDGFLLLEHRRLLCVPFRLDVTCITVAPLKRNRRVRFFFLYFCYVIS